MVFWLGVCAVLAAQATEASPVVRVETVEGRAVAGRWQGIDDEGRLVLRSDEGDRMFSVSELSILQWPAGAPSSRPVDTDVPWMVHLPDGSRFAANMTGGDGEKLIFKTRFADELALAISNLAGIQFAAISENDLTGQFRLLLERRDASEDALIALRNEELTRLKGATESITAQHIRFNWRDRSREFAIDSVFGLLIASGVPSSDKPPVQCYLRSGEVWSGTLGGGDRTQIELELAIGQRVTLPLDQVAEVRFHSNRVLSLSELEPSEYVFEPFATTRWEWRRDRSVANRPMRIGGRTYARGIGMHSQSKLVFDIEPGYRHFAADIGIDDAVGHHGHVIMRVLADGKEVFHSGPVTGGDEPRSILVPIDNVKELTLVVEYGEELDIGDQANWANARLVK